MAVHILSQCTSKPRQGHWYATQRVVRFLKGTPGKGIPLCSESDISLKSWCGSNWAASPLTRRNWLVGWFLGTLTCLLEDEETINRILLFD